MMFNVYNHSYDSWTFRHNSIRRTIELFDPEGYATVIGAAGVALYLIEDSYPFWPTSLDIPEAVYTIADRQSIESIASTGRRSTLADAVVERHPKIDPDPAQAWHPSHPTSRVIVKPAEGENLLRFHAVTHFEDDTRYILSPSVVSHERIRVAGTQTLPVGTLSTHMAATYPPSQATGIAHLTELVRGCDKPVLSPPECRAIRTILDLRSKALTPGDYSRRR